MKKTIYTIVIIVGFGGALVMLYLAMFSSPGNSSSETPVQSAAPYNVLPKGNNLDFTTLKNYNKDNRRFNYPQVNSSEIGKNLLNLMQ